MLRLSAEAKVGIFVFMGLLLLVYMSLRVGGMRLGREEGYLLSVRLDSAAGLDKDASVKIAGVEVGRVKDIILEGHKAKLILRVRPDVKVGKDFVAVLKTSGLLGERYLELLPGSPNAPYLANGEEITRVMTYTDMDKLINILSEVAVDIKSVTASMSQAFGSREGEEKLKNIVSNLEEITVSVNAVIQQNDEKFSSTMTNFEDFSSSLRDVSRSLNALIAENKDDLRAGVENLRRASVKLEEAMDTISKVAPEVKNTVSSIGSIAKKIDQGQGTIGKLINEPTTHDEINKTLTGINSYIERAERFRTFVSYRGEYLFDAKDVKNYFSLRIQPKADKYYLLEIVDDPRGYRKTDKKKIIVNGVLTTTKVTTTSESVKFSAQLAKRFDNLAVRGGIIESTGGAGVDYYFFKDMVKVTFEAFDFDKERGPHLKVGANLHINNYFFVTAGYDDFASKVGLESAYLGLGLQFEDEDLKYLFSNAPPVRF
ncbi:MAG: MCE family protein [Deltaproteobacteria bacterium]|nr:MCE family protein [Deltaproteobacteria bacterium]